MYLFEREEEKKREREKESAERGEGGRVPKQPGQSPAGLETLVDMEN